MGEEQYSPRGKNYLLQIMDEVEKDPEAAKEFRKLLFTCTMCGRCKETCSSDVDLLKIWHEQRGKAIHEHPEEFAYLSPLQDALENVQNIYGLDPEDRAMFWLDELEDEIPGLSDRVYEPGKKAEVMVFLGCLMSFRSSQLDVLRSLFKSLEKSGTDYMVMGAEEFCCGHPLYLMGDDEGASELRKHNKSVIVDAGANKVITCCPGCLIQLKEHHDLKDIDALHHTQYFDMIHEKLPEFETTESYAYHDPCELHRILGIKKEPRSLMNKMNVKYRDIEPSCCGGGGLLRMTDSNLSDIIIKMRAASEGLKDVTVLTCCPSCREQLLSNNLKTQDIIELVADVLEKGGD